MIAHGTATTVTISSNSDVIVAGCEIPNRSRKDRNRNGSTA